MKEHPAVPITPFTNLADAFYQTNEDEVSDPTPEWPGFRREADRMSSLNISQARMINHQSRGIFTSSLESLLAAKGERALLMEVCCSPESFLSPPRWNGWATERSGSPPLKSTWPCRTGDPGWLTVFAKTHRVMHGSVYRVIRTQCRHS